MLGYLEKTKAETSPGLQFEVEPGGDPEELGAEGKYYQEFDVTIRYEVKLGSCALESEGAYFSGKWVAESAQWPTLLQGLIPLPRVAIQEGQRQELVTAALPAGLDIIKAYDDIVDGAEARKRLEQTNPALVAARDKAITDLRREKVNQDLAKKQALQQGRAARR